MQYNKLVSLSIFAANLLKHLELNETDHKYFAYFWKKLNSV